MRILLTVALLVATQSAAQTHPWDGILPPSRAKDWSQVGIPGGIPNITTICSSSVATGTSGLNITIPIQPSGDTTGNTDQININTALGNCGTFANSTTPPVPQVVQLAAGTFYTKAINFGGPLSGSNGTTAKNNLVLRGAGPDQTVLAWVGNTANNGVLGCGYWGYVCIQGNNASPSGGGVTNTTWTGTNGVDGTYTQGASVINVGSTAGMVVAPTDASGRVTSAPSGSIIVLDQRADYIGICPATILGGGTGPGCAPGGTPVNGASEVGTTVTIHTSMPHGFNVGDCVGIGNSIIQAWNVTGAIWASGTETLTIGANALAAGAMSPTTDYGTGNKQIVVAGVNPTAINGTRTVTGATSTTVSFALATDPGAFVPGTGTVTSQPRGYSSDQNMTMFCPASAGGGLTGMGGWLQVTAVPDNYTFQYTSENSNLAPGGGGTSNAWVTKDTGGVYYAVVVGPVSNEGGGNGRKCPDTKNTLTCLSGEISVRSPIEYKRIVDICGSGGTWQVAGGACTANTVRIDPPVELPNYRTSQAPGVYWLGNYAVGDGLESVTVDMAVGPYDSSLQGVILWGAYQSWVKNIRTFEGNRNHVLLQYDARVNVEDNYFFGMKGSASQSYGIEDWSEDSLKQNNICQHVMACTIVGGDFGGVFGYNFAIDGPWGAGSAQGLNLIQLTNLNHDYVGMVLEEGDNTSYNFTDNIHGVGSLVSMFRNRYRANDTPRKNSSMLAQWSAAYNRFNNVVDNVMGLFPGDMNYYEKIGSYGGNAIFNLGWQAENYNVAWDSLVRDTILRWGNYDVCTDAGIASNTAQGIPCIARAGSNGIRFCGNSSDTGWTTTCLNNSGTPVSEIPLTNHTFMPASPVPTKGDTAIGQSPFPASFYLSAQPLWWQTAWGTPGWPAIGSDVNATGPLNATCTDPAVNLQFATSTKCDGVANHSYQTPSQLCFNNLPMDPAGMGPPGPPPGTPQQVYAITAFTVASSANSYYSTVTIGPHTIPVGATFRISGTTGTQSFAFYTNRSWMVFSTTSTTVTFYQPNPNGAWTSGGYVSWPNMQQSYPITAVDWFQGTTGCLIGTGCVRFTIGPHTLNVGDVFTVTGATPSDYNGTWMVLFLDATTITMNQPPARQPGPWQSGTGVITWPNVRNYNAATCYPVAYSGFAPPLPPTVSMSVSPTNITAGQSAVLSWLASNADTVSIAPIGTVANSGSESVSPSTTTTYTLTAANVNGTNGATAVLTVVQAPTVQPHIINGMGTINGSAVIR